MGVSTEGKSSRPLPSVVAYGRGLPDGWGSYPACRASASLLGSLQNAGVLEDLVGLPEEIESYIRPIAEPWIPEVVHVTVMLALRDQRFTGPNGESAFVTWLHRLNGELMLDRSGLGPQAALHGLPGLWSDLHQGTEIRVIESRNGSALVAYLYPEPLFPPLANRWRRDAIAGYLVRAGAVQPRITELGRVGDATHVSITWT